MTGNALPAVGHIGYHLMKCLKSSSEDLRRLFDRNISVRFITEYLVSFDGEARATDVLACMVEHDYDVVGIRQKGVVRGYANRTDLGDGVLADHKIEFADTDLIDETDPLIEVFESLRLAPRLFVVMFGQVGGIVTRGDLQKAPVRMWLFGLITLIEMQLLRIIREHCPDQSWKKYLANTRIQAAVNMLSGRKSRNEAIDLADCLQFCDKRDIVLKNGDLRRALGLNSTRAAEKLFRNLENLRNDLAHAQDIVAGNWPDIVDWAHQAERLLEHCEDLCIQE